jgi:hypothetical protein
MSTKNRSASSETEESVQYLAAVSNPDLQKLDRLVGAWEISDPSGKDEISGHISYEWVEGGFFLLQRFDLLHGEHRNKGVEYIGHFQMFGEEPSDEIKTRVFSFLDGMVLDYVYELEGDTLIIWAGAKGSPAYFKGQFSEDGNSLTGAWVYPGGGYQSKMSRVK